MLQLIRNLQLFHVYVYDRHTCNTLLRAHYTIIAIPLLKLKIPPWLGNSTLINARAKNSFINISFIRYKRQITLINKSYYTNSSCANCFSEKFEN